MLGLRKRQMRILLLMLICIFVYTAWFTYNNQNNIKNDDFIRFYVVANSDTATDQQLKAKVRDAVLAKVNSELVQETMARHNAQITAEKANYTMDAGQDGAQMNTTTLDLDSSREYITNHLNDIEHAALAVIEQNGYDYDVTAKLGKQWLPEKKYGEGVLPAGNYEALCITIGEGKGK